MKKAIIIGASSGIGACLALELTNKGYQTGITGRREHLLQELKAKRPESMTIAVLDNTQTEALEARLNELVLQIGGLDLLVISSGTGDLNEQLDFGIESNIISLNVTAFTQIADWATRYFVAQGFGHLAGISSIAGLTGSAAAPAYNAGKAYQINYLKGLRKNVRKKGVRVTITDVRPGFVATAMAKGPGQFWVASPEKAARQILSAIGNKRNVVYVTKRWRLVAWLFTLFG